MNLGPHIILPSAAAMAWARQAPIVKALDVDVLQAAPPNAVRIFRHFLPNQNTADPIGTANAVLAALGGYHHPNLFVELWNEAHPTLDQLATAASICHANGYKVAGGSWGTGDYTEQDWAIARAAGVDAISVHCYFGNRGFTPYHAVRYRQFWRQGDPPVIISEAGRDAVEGGGKGWQASGVSAEQYAAELANYATTIARDPYVIGATVFTAGPTSDWANFSTDPLTDLILSKLGVTIVTDTTTTPTSPNWADLEAKIQRLEAQNAILTNAWKALRQGKFTGADGIDGLIVAMQGGAPLGFTPTYPPLA